MKIIKDTHTPLYLLILFIAGIVFLTGGLYFSAETQDTSVGTSSPTLSEASSSLQVALRQFLSVS